MVFNYGPRGANGEHIDFNPGIGGGKFDPSKDLLFSYQTQNGSISSNIVQAQTDGICYLKESNKNWDLEILKNCSIEFLKNGKNITLFMIGGGSGGDTGTVTCEPRNGDYSNQYWESTGGQGGKGGKYLLKENYTLLKNEYEIVIGTGGNAGGTSSGAAGSPGGDTVIKLDNEILLSTSSSTNEQAKGGTTSSVSSGAAFDTVNGGPGDPGFLFHNSNSFCYGGGGGGGGAFSDTGRTAAYGSGGAGGGGSGYNSGSMNGTSNTGGGGGGGGAKGDRYGNKTYYSGGNGGSGIIIISNYL